MGPFVSAAKGINVAPCLLTSERDFVRCKAYDISILFMQLLLALD